MELCCGGADHAAYLGNWGSRIVIAIPGSRRADALGAGKDAARENIMAKVLRNPKSGKQGNAVSYDTPFGQAERVLKLPRNPRSPAQQRVRGALGHFAARWRGLTNDQRIVWINEAKEVDSEPRLGQRGQLTGCQLYLKINCTLAAIGQEPVDMPPAHPQFSANPTGALTATVANDAVSLQLKVTRAPVCYIMVWGTAPCSQGVMRSRRFALLGALPAPASGVSDIAALYVAKFGVPPAGTRVFIRTQQTINGWTDLPQETTAIVGTP